MIATIQCFQGKAMILLTSAHCGKKKLAALLTAQITAAATPLPLEKATVTRQATQSSEMPLTEIPAIPFREKTLTKTQNLTPIAQHSPCGNPLIPTAAPRYLVLLHPPERHQVAAEQLSSAWKNPGAPAASDLELVDMATRIAANPLMTRVPPIAYRSLLPHLRFKCGGTPPPRAPWSPQSRASRRWGPQDGTRRSMP